MNKYSSGYILLSFLTVIGALVSFVSIAFGVYIFFESPRGVGYTGIIIAIGGFIQGLFLYGVAEIGRAILDGSLAQQDLLKLMSKAPELSSGVVQKNSGEGGYPILPSSGIVKSYKGHKIVKIDNNFSIEGMEGTNFDTVLAAEKWIDTVYSRI